MISPNTVVDGFTWKEVTGPGTTLREIMQVFKVTFIRIIL